MIGAEPFEKRIKSLKSSLATLEINRRLSDYETSLWVNYLSTLQELRDHRD